MPKVYSININKNGGVPKYPVNQVYIGKYRVTGDKQNDLKHHGGENRAVCLYSMDLITELKNEGHPIFAGSTGENITIQGQDWNKLKQGVLLEGETVHLSTTEYEALLLFAENPGQVLDREQLVENLRGITWQSYDRSVDVLVSRLRNKLGETPTNIRFIKTVHGVGYKFIGKPKK